MLVQTIPRFVGSLPPVGEFTAYVARRPPPLVEVRPCVRAQRHVVEQFADIAPMVQILDSPVPQTSEQLLEVFRLLDTHMPVEQAIAVPKIFLDRIPQRSFVLTPQSADQLVEVPTVLSPTRIALQIAEQIVDTPVPYGRAGADALPPRYLGTVYRVHVAGGVIKRDDERMLTFQSSRMELAVGYRVSFFVRWSAAYGLTRVFL